MQPIHPLTERDRQTGRRKSKLKSRRTRMLEQRTKLLFGGLSILCFLVTTTGFDIAARVFVASQSFRAAARESVYYATVQPFGTMLLAAPYLAVGILSTGVVKRTGLIKASLFFVVVVAVLGALYFFGYWGAQQALVKRAWTAAALSVGLLPFMSIPIIIIAVIATRSSTLLGADKPPPSHPSNER
jgi:hypothetical protein